MIFEGLSLATVMSIVSMLGLPGLVLIFWYVDQRRLEQEQKSHLAALTAAEARHAAEMVVIREQFAAAQAAAGKRFDAAMAEAEKRFDGVVRMYEDNVLLVRGYERLAGDLANIIHLNTQTQTRLAEKIEHNMHCPIVRDGGTKWALTAKG